MAKEKVKETENVAKNSDICDIEAMVPDGQLTEKKMNVVLDKMRGFMTYKRETAPYRPPGERLKDWNEIYNFPRVRKGLRVQAARCMECGVPFCQSSHGCPLGNIIPKWNDLIYQDNWEEALKQLLQTNNFPEFTGRVCPAPCEGACVLGINEPAVTIKNIECAIIDNAFERGWIKPEPPLKRSGKMVAVIGSGPAGMAAAAQLNKAGHLVSVYERNNRIGGLLQYGIPTMKLSKAVVQRRVELMAAEGILFHTGVNVGTDLSGLDVLEKYDAVLVTTGATWPRDLPIPGRQMEGIYFAMSFLERWQKIQMGDDINLGVLTAENKNVLVVGGGDTGCDCIGTALRQGAKSITSFEILPEPLPGRADDNPWPQWPKIFRVDYGHDEVKLKWGKDPRQYSVLSKEFIDNGNGQVAGIKTVQVEWTKDDKGRWSMKEVEGSEKTYKADLVLLAMGFLGPEKYLNAQLGVNEDPRSNILTPNGKFNASVAKVYAAGDCRRGQSLVVHAINEGRQAARQIDLDLTTATSLPGPGGVIQLMSTVGA
uniref:4Fe-4S ferredoxin-type domain-containing protein n=1 Tax=Strigamia maritima TaxID=126957 RepID=T1IRL5_STRMM